MSDETQHSPQPTPPLVPDGVTVQRPHTSPNPETLAESPAGATATGPTTAFAFHPVAVPGYEILGELGRGGMGVVYRARQMKLNRVVALKMVLSGAHADSRELLRFLAEGEAVAAIRHPHVVQVYDVGECDGRPYMAMECLEGGSLVDRLRAGGKMPPRAAAELVMKVAGGVQAAHDHGIVHRDLKPHNIMLQVEDRVEGAGAPGAGHAAATTLRLEDLCPKVMDFGIAKRGASDLTQTGAIMGTPAYMAPEQARGETKAVGPAADVYSLGVILYECLTGTVPFTGPDPWSIIRQVVSDEPQPASRRTSGVPRDLDLICRKCLAKLPAERYASAAALADDLRRFLAGEAVRGARTGVWYATRKTATRWWRPVAALSALVAIVLVAWIIPSPLNRKPEPPREDAPREEDPIVKLRREEVIRRVETLRRTRPTPDREPPLPVTKLPELPAVDFSAFRVISDERTVDLRDWRPVTPDNPTADCFIMYHTRRQLMKVAPAAELRTEMRTSGRDVIMRALQPDPKKAKAFATDKPGFVGEQAMKVRQLVFDVSDIPVDTEFTLQFANTYMHSLQSESEQWFGVIGYEGSFKISMLMLFPADRPFRDYELLVAPTRADNPKDRTPVPYTGPVIRFAADDKSWIYWEIPDPKANHVYRVDWMW